LIIAAAAVLGYGLIALPPAISESYETIARVNPDLALAYLALVAALGVLLAVFIVVKSFQMWRRSRAKRRREKLPSAMTEREIRNEIAGRQLEAEEFLSSLPADEQQQLGTRISGERSKMQEETLEIAAFGTISSGKSSLLNALIGAPVFVTDARGGTTAVRNEWDWPDHGKVRLVDTPGLGEMHGQNRAAAALQSARTADLVIYVTDGVLRDFEHGVIRELAGMDKRLLICLNKEDTFTAGDREVLLGQMQRQLKGLVPAHDFVSVRANPATRVRVRITPDGGEHEETVAVEPDVSALARRMLEIIGSEGNRLLLSNLLIRARGLVSDTKQMVREHLDKEARELVGRYMWQAGGAAALSPFPVLDIAAGLGISYKMVIDIAAVYRQKIDFDSAREMVAQAGKNLVASAGVLVATPGIAALAASALKTVPGVGTITGGVLQGLVQALVTRWIGRVFIQYFSSEMSDPGRTLPAVGKSEWAEVTRPGELIRLVQEGTRHFRRNEANDAR
jgi:GTP-binding protein EngB required for normal cell division/uncharacterized protein (DUF697 family)